MTLFGNILVSFFIAMVVGASIVAFAKAKPPIMKNYDGKSLTDTIFKIYFGSNSAGITSDQSKVVRYIYRDLEKLEAMGELNWDEYKLYIIGNCSKNNSKYRSDSASHSLAMDRSSSVSLDLISYGISADNIILKGNGNLNPSNYRNADVCDIVLRKVANEYHDEYTEY